MVRSCITSNSEKSALMIYYTGIAENLLSTLWRTSVSISGNWSGSCLGELLHELGFEHHQRLSLRRLYKTRIWMASLQGTGGYEQ